MTLADELKALPSLLLAAEKEKERVERLRSAAEGLTRQLRETPGAPTRDHDKLSRLVAQLCDAEQRHAERLLAYEAAASEIEMAVEALPDPARTVVNLRFVRGYSWKHVAARTGYTERHCKRIGMHACS